MKVTRLIVYEGTQEWIAETLSRSIHGKRTVGPGKSITAFTLGVMPDDVTILAKEHEDDVTNP